MELDFNKYCLVETSPTTVLPAPRCYSNRKTSRKPKCVDDIARLNKDLEINFNDYHCGSSRDVQSQRVGNEVVKRGSIYQSSKEVRLLEKTASAFSFEVIDSLCNSDEDSSLVVENRTSLMSLSERSTTSLCENKVDVDVDSFPHSPECDGSRSSSSKARFGPIKKMLDPFVKHKSHRSPLSSFNETGGELDDKLEKENHNSVVQCSPAHLNGLLKSGTKHGVPFFQFSVKSPEDVYVAKTWKVGNASTWVYTFHSLPHRKTNGWGFKESNRQSSMVGQMHVSCHLCTEFRELKDFMVTEFVLYDITHSRKSIDDSRSCDDVTKPPSLPHPEMEIAAIVMQVPLEKRESLKFKSGDKKIAETPPNLLDLFRVGKVEGISDNSSPGKMHVLIPAGHHSLAVTQSRGPSPLLDRWRLGGGCDCGGWDMACPLNILTNPTVKIAHNHNPTELFLQGRKDKIPAFSMRMMEDGKYAVNFHAQLSSLQAFSICVAILHAADASTVVGKERSKQMLHTDPLGAFEHKEIKIMSDVISSGEEKCNVNKMEEILPSFLLNPPFSPIARV